MTFSNYFQVVIVTIIVQPATAALFGYECPDLSSLNEVVDATIASGKPTGIRDYDYFFYDTV